MDSQQVSEKLKSRAAELRRLGVASLRLFGSAARGQAKADSDIDLLVRFVGAPSFDHFMDLRMLLEETLGTEVDLVTEDALRPALRDAIERDAIRVA